jgi:hypothetical protein
MNILRVPPYPITISYDVPDPDSEYILVIDNLVTGEETEVNLTSDANSKIEYELDGDFLRYDQFYPLTVYTDILGERADIVVQDNLDISRPYVKPSTLGTTATEIAKYTEYEGLARMIIDSLTDGFYYTKAVLETNGSGTDFFPLWNTSYRILKVYENTVLVWDSSEETPALGDFNYLLTKDKTSIIKDPVNEVVGPVVRQEGGPVGVGLANSDSFSIYETDDGYGFVPVKFIPTFPEHWNYLVYLETGYPVVPADIQDATRMLINDMECGKLEYYKRYITNYSTDQYRVQMDKSVLEGTGNILVDKIIEKYTYKEKFRKPGVL